MTSFEVRPNLARPQLDAAAQMLPRQEQIRPIVNISGQFQIANREDTMGTVVMLLFLQRRFQGDDRRVVSAPPD